MDPRISQLKANLATAMRRDRGRLERRLDQAAGRLKRGQPADRMLEGVAAELAESARLREWRAEHLPKPEFPENLPVAARRDAITAALAENPVIVVAGETGSGKTTQLPKICLAAGRGVEGMIGHTQPRRIAARSLAARIGEELGDPGGHSVGHKVRFADHTRPETFVKVMTDGILLAEARSDRLLAAYDTIIVDEAHERSLNIDFLLGYLKNLLPKRPDLKVIVTSATIDTARFAAHFNAPVVEVSGRTYPVEVRYRPLEGNDGALDVTTGILRAVDELAGASREGDMLVFLPGERDIRETAEALKKHHPERTEIVPLYARLSASEQSRVFRPGPQRRIVLATNVAETSLTVPRIHYVIDPGTARISRYSPRARVQRLPIEKVSRASADQRKGRCGRIAEGVCIRLYSAEDFYKRDEFTEPEIRRTNLAAVILRMLELDLGDIAEFPFVDPPDRRQIADGYALLQELGAVDGRRELTGLGRRMAGFHVDPRLARMVLAAERYHCLREVLVIAAFLSVRDPRERPAEERAKADQAHAQWKDERSDFMAALNLWDWYHGQARHLSQNKLRKLCKANFLSFVRMREWHDLQRELGNQVKEMGFKINQQPGTYDEIHKSLLSGLLGHVGQREEKREYRAARDGRFLLFPGSGLVRGKAKPPLWLMAAEVVETERRYARVCAAIEPEWAVEVGAHLVKRSWSDPRWEKRRGAVVATERATLYGLPVQPGRTVQYGKVSPEEAREWFIRAALTPCDIHSRAPFLEHNRRVREQLEEAAAKRRDRGQGVDPEALFAFFDARLPEGISDIRAFDRWRRDAEGENPRLLFLDAEELGAKTALPPDLFPDRLEVAGQELPLSYRFRLGHPEDGVTVTVPLAMLGGLTPEPFEWLVPGLLRDKVGHLLRTLPKTFRKRFMPWPHWAGRFVDAVRPHGGLTEALTRWLQAEARVSVPPDAWDPEKLPEHLRMRFRVVDTGGKEVAAGRDLGDLQRYLGGAARRDFVKLPKEGFETAGLHDWSVTDLPEQVALGGGVTGYPALTDEGDSVAVRLYGSAAEAAAHHRRGLLKLAELRMGKAFRQLTRAAVPQNAAMRYAPLGGKTDLRGDALNAALEHLFEGAGNIRERAAFEALVAHVQRHLAATLAQAITCAADALAEWHAAVTALKGTTRGAPESLTDIREHLAALIHPGFISDTPFEHLPHLPRLLKAEGVRIRKMNENPARDAARLKELQPLHAAWSRYVAERKSAALEIPSPVAEYRWLLEELRVSLFAQEVGTAVPVSLQRLTRRWEEISR